MLLAVLNNSFRQHPTIHQLYGHLPPITKTIQVRRTRHAGHCWRSRDELISHVLLWTPIYGRQKQDDQLEHSFSSYVRIQDVTLKTNQRRWTIRRSGERGSGISVQSVRHDDGDDIYIYIYMYIFCAGKHHHHHHHHHRSMLKARIPMTLSLSLSLSSSLSLSLSIYQSFFIAQPPRTDTSKFFRQANISVSKFRSPW